MSFLKSYSKSILPGLIPSRSWNLPKNCSKNYKKSAQKCKENWSKNCSKIVRKLPAGSNPGTWGSESSPSDWGWVLDRLGNSLGDALKDRLWDGLKRSPGVLEEPGEGFNSCADGWIHWFVTSFSKGRQDLGCIARMSLALCMLWQNYPEKE